MVALSVNLNKIALIRNSREGNFPDVITHGKICLLAGAHGITVHPRPDLRHIRPTDVTQLYHLVQQYNIAHARRVELNVEGNPFAEVNKNYPGFIEIIRQAPPDQCTLVPDSTSQLTSDHGFELGSAGKELAPIIDNLKKMQVRISLFMDPDIEQISRAADIGADRIELYTGPFAKSFAENPDGSETKQLFAQHCKAAEHAHKLGLGVNAGHDLNLSNLSCYRNLPHLAEVSIGHALTVDALDIGLAKAVTAYLKALGPKTRNQ